jgi:hypothetical protein
MSSCQEYCHVMIIVINVLYNTTTSLPAVILYQCNSSATKRVTAIIINKVITTVHTLRSMAQAELLFIVIQSIC